MDPLALSKAVPKIVKLDGLWCAVFQNLEGGSPKILFRSLDRKNVEAFIKYSWNGVNDYA